MSEREGASLHRPDCQTRALTHARRPTPRPTPAAPSAPPLPRALGPEGPLRFRPDERKVEGGREEEEEGGEGGGADRTGGGLGGRGAPVCVPPTSAGVPGARAASRARHPSKRPRGARGGGGRAGAG